MIRSPHDHDPNVITGNRNKIDLSALKAPVSSGFSFGDGGSAPPRPTGGMGSGPAPQQPAQQGGIPVDPSVDQQADPTKKEESLKDVQAKCKNLRIKIYGYYNKLPEMMALVDWPHPIVSIMHWNLEQLEELYQAVIESRDASSISGGPMLHNGLVNGMEQIGIQYGFYLNGFAEEMMLDMEAKNLKVRLKQLVTILEIEHGLGIQSPLLEYAGLMFGTAAMRHQRLKNEDRTLFYQQQQIEQVPDDILNEFSHL